MFQATAMDVITAYQNIRLVKKQLKTLRDNRDKVFEDVWTSATTSYICRSWVDITQTVWQDD